MSTASNTLIALGKTAAILIGGIYILGYIVDTFKPPIDPSKSTVQYSPTTAPAPKKMKEQPSNNDRVSIIDWSWRKGGFSTVFVGKFVIRNDNSFPIKDIRILCSFFGKSETRLGVASAVVYDIIPAKSTKTFKDVNFGFVHSQASSGTCQIDAVQF